MPEATVTTDPSAQLNVPLDPAFSGELAAAAAGRVVVLDYFANWRCGVVTGDLTARFRDAEGAGPFLEAAPVDGVRILVEERLRDVLTRSGPTLRLTGRARRRRLVIDLARPELWLDFLNGAGVLRGKLWS